MNLLNRFFYFVEIFWIDELRFIFHQREEKKMCIVYAWEINVISEGNFLGSSPFLLFMYSTMDTTNAAFTFSQSTQQQQQQQHEHICGWMNGHSIFRTPKIGCINQVKIIFENVKYNNDLSAYSVTELMVCCCCWF